MADLDEFRERSHLLAEVARPMIASGAGADEVAAELLRISGSPILTIRAIAAATGMGNGQAKWIVHRNLEPEVRAAAERLWADAVDAFEDVNHPPAEDDAAR
ncbi:hypothetical protein ACFPIJ_11720 [Dactylosporangium cerinum]|uniref:Transcriptional regulator n=1 Tax=Dactylosporangium cerinum TaxID=1434730 RepID=A0ABV9VU91_9ACTN